MIPAAETSIKRLIIWEKPWTVLTVEDFEGQTNCFEMQTSDRGKWTPACKPREGL